MSEWFGRAVGGIADGIDVYAFLIGMMALAAIARERGLFDRFAAYAVRQARGSSSRLFAIVFAIATLVAALLSNDAAAVVLTPAVARAAKRGGVPPLPHLYACAFVANAASFLLPIGNPANLVIYGAQLPGLASWVGGFAVPSLAALAATFVLLRVLLRRDLAASLGDAGAMPALDGEAKRTAAALALACVALIVASFVRAPLGVTTIALAVLVFGIAGGIDGRFARTILGAVDWPILALTAALFGVVGLLRATPLVDDAAALVARSASLVPMVANLTVGAGFALACNVTNNLPVGLIARAVSERAHDAPRVVRAIVVAVDLGPNIAAHASLATLLWLAALKREGVAASAFGFFRLGLVVGSAALLAALLVV